MSKPDGGPAFSRTGHYDEHGPSESDCTSQVGMTLRQWYAGLAMQELISEPWFIPATEQSGATRARDLAIDAFIIADAMIAAEKGKA
jgi:hypothetical protein